MKKIKVRILNDNDTEFVNQTIRENWNSNLIVTLGKMHYADKLPGFIASVNKKKLGLITFNIENNECEIITLNSLESNIGIGTALLRTVEKYASKMRCKRLWVITTNDNTDALRFYQKKGFKIKKIYRDSIEISRRLKPEIPKYGINDIEILDEIELEKLLFVKEDKRGALIKSILLNPTIDQIYEIDNFFIGGTFKIKESIIYPVGKAISFSLGIRELAKERDIIKVIACIGKDDTALYSDFLRSREIDFEFVKVDGKTRSNKTINDPIKKTTTHIREIGFKINKKNISAFFEKLKNNIYVDDIVVFSGSIPPGVNNDIYYKMINICKDKGALTVLDSNGQALVNGVKANPNIIKPNLVELSQILNDAKLNELDFSNIIQTSKIIVKKAKSLLNKELEIILITLGVHGAICLTIDNIYYGYVQIDEAIDTVGSGDAFLAGFILNHFQNKELKECFRSALACGAANTLITGPGVFQIEDVKRIIKKVKIFDLN